MVVFGVVFVYYVVVVEKGGGGGFVLWLVGWVARGDLGVAG